MSATPDEFLYRISCMYFLPCQDHEKPDHAWLDDLFRKHPPTIQSGDEDIARLRYVLCRISHEALLGSAGVPPTADQREKVLKRLKSLDSAYAALWGSIEELPIGFRPLVERRRDAQLAAIEEWIAFQSQKPRGRGSSKDQWRDSLFRTLLGFYDLGYGLHWRGSTRRRANGARPGEIVGDRQAPAAFIRAYLVAIQSVLGACDFVPEREDDALKERWFAPTTPALLEKMETFRRGDLECTTWKPPLVLGSTHGRTSIDDPPIVSVAQKIWLEAGGRIPDAMQSG